MKKILFISVVLSSLILISGCEASSTSNTDEIYDTTTITAEEITTEEATINLNDYKTKISEFNNNIYDASILLSNVASYEHSYWENLEEIGGSVNSEKLYEKAIEWLIENAEGYNVTYTTHQDNYDDICKAYSEIVGMGIDISEVSAINNTYEELFNNYCMLYTLAMSPDGSINTFVDNYNEYINNIEKNNTMLISFLE